MWSSSRISKGKRALTLWEGFDEALWSQTLVVCSVPDREEDQQCVQRPRDSQVLCEREMVDKVAWHRVFQWGNCWQ